MAPGETKTVILKPARHNETTTSMRQVSVGA
jgi:hypothetical protein